MQKDQLDGLLALKTVAELRNFTAAAEVLNVTPSAVSQTIKALETRLGVALLTRTTRATYLTEIGARFLEKAGPAMEQILAALVDVGAYASIPSGLLRINTLSFACPLLLPLVASFAKKFPEVTVELAVEDVPSDIFERGFDLGVRISDIVAKDMLAVKLFGPIRFVVAGSPKYLKQMGRPKTPQDLLAHKCICVRIGAGLYERWEFEHKGKDVQVQVNPAMIIDDPLLVVDAAVEGAGLIYVTEDVIEPQVRSGKLEVILSPFAAASSGYYLYYPQRAQLQPKLRAFIDHVKLNR